MKIRLTNTADAARFMVAGLLLIIAALLWVLAHPLEPEVPTSRPARPPVHWPAPATAQPPVHKFNPHTRAHCRSIHPEWTPEACQ